MTGTDRPIWALGLMSGTSLDGIDAALIRTDGVRLFENGPAVTIPYDGAFRAMIKPLFGRQPAAGDPSVAAGARALAERHASAVAALLAETDIRPQVIGFHGQTVFHAPHSGVTVQIGDAALLARLTGVPVVADFRSRDVAEGGEGAPLAPAYHQALVRDMVRETSGPLAVLNLGGVGNVTWIGPDPDAPPLAFDTGPGNALIDDWMLTRTGQPCDRDGALAATGTIDSAALATLMAHPYFRRAAPKSLDRDAFSTADLARLSDADGAATLTAFTVAAVVRALDHLPQPPVRWLVCGGGRRNHTLMTGLRRALAVPVEAVETVGWDGDALEARAFAYLAVRSLRGLPLSWPTTTGVPRPMGGGRLSPPG